MPVQPLRRISAPPPSLYDEIASYPLHALYFRRDVAAVEREHPSLIMRRGANVLLAQPAGETKLSYAFESDQAFTELFPEMLEKLLPRIRRELRADAVRFRLAHNPSRPLVEPVLKRLLFAPKRDWLEFSIAGRADTKPAALPGLRFRQAGIANVEEIARLDRDAFPDTPMPLAAYRKVIEGGAETTILALRGRRAVGFCSYACPDPSRGYVHTLAVESAARGEGIGEALTLRALGALAALGAQETLLTTDGDNTAAIRLYRKLGFRQSRAGRDYLRPVDPREVAKLAERQRGTLIKFGGWR